MWFPLIFRTLYHQLLPVYLGMNYETVESYQEFRSKHPNLVNLAILLPSMNGTIYKSHFDNVNRSIPSVICSKPIHNITFRSTLLVEKRKFSIIHAILRNFCSNFSQDLFDNYLRIDPSYLQLSAEHYFVSIIQIKAYAFSETRMSFIP